MNAKEARELVLWNKLPEFIKNKIEESIKNGERFAIIPYQSPDYRLIESKIHKIIDYLTELDYNVIDGDSTDNLGIFW